ncbi:MAG: histidine phosphatase family protein [Planctomycetota bacterium]
MSRRLILQRHAKSSWKDATLTDHARPLNKRGRRAAPAVAGYLQRTGWCPQLVLCSDAARTRETWARSAPEWAVEPPVSYLPEFYGAGASTIAAAISVVPTAVETVLLVGHNPGWEQAASRWTRTPVVLKTADAALLEAPPHFAHSPWSVVDLDQMRLVAVVRARAVTEE